jgi:hypothetical protein
MNLVLCLQNASNPGRPGPQVIFASNNILCSLCQRVHLGAWLCIALTTMHILLFDTVGSDDQLTQALTVKTL